MNIFSHNRFSFFELCFSVAILGMLTLLVEPAFAQAPAWDMALTVNHASSEPTEIIATATDSEGNAYIAGNFYGQASFSKTTLTSVGDADVFVAKWNAKSKNFVWAVSAGGSDKDGIKGLSVNGRSIYIVGNSIKPDFSAANAKKFAFGGKVLTADSQKDGFIAKLVEAETDSSVSFSWAMWAGGVWNEGNTYGLTSVAVNGTNVYVAGSFNSKSASFGSNDVKLNRSGFETGHDLFVAKLTDTGSTGKFVWVQKAGSAGDNIANSLAVHGANIYVAGWFSGATILLGKNSLTNGGKDDAFISKLKDDGNTGSFIWSQRLGGIGEDKASSIAVNGASVYVTGQFEKTAVFGKLALTSAGKGDAFIVKLTDLGITGSVVWAKRAGGERNDAAMNVAVSGTNLYVAGGASNPSTFDKKVFPSGPEPQDIFVWKLSDLGIDANFAWVQQAGYGYTDHANSVSVSGANVYVGGKVGPNSRFGSQKFKDQIDFHNFGFLALIKE